MKQLSKLELTIETLAPTAQVYDDQRFERLFKSHYRELHAYAHTMLQDKDSAEEIVQSMFLRFWEKRDMLNIQTSIRAYLYRAVYNDTMNHLKHQKIKTKYQDFTVRSMNDSHEPASAKVELSQLEQKIQEALNDLPEHCRTIFQMSRFEELKYREIAERLDLSIKTVENQMGKALKILRLKLADYLTLLALSLPALIMYYRNFFK